MGGSHVGRLQFKWTVVWKPGKKKTGKKKALWVSVLGFFELTGHWCAATDQKWERGSCLKDSVGKLSTRWAHTDTHASTYLHTSIQHICTWRGRDGKSFQLSVGVFVRRLQIAKRAQRLYIALNLRLSFVETGSGYLCSGVGDSRAFNWLTSEWVTGWLTPTITQRRFHSFRDCF